MNKTLLITRPDHDITTRYLRVWSNHIIKIADEKNIKILDLDSKKANKKELESRIEKIEPSLIIFNGHGSDDCITGYENEILVQAGNNEKLLKSKIIYAVSCNSAAKLGPESIKSGALSYIGYADSFIFFHENNFSNPLVDKTAALFLEPSNQAAISLIKGNNSGDSSKRSKKYFSKNMRELLSSKYESRPEFTQYAQALWWNMKHQVCLGDEEARF